MDVALDIYRGTVTGAHFLFQSRRISAAFGTQGAFCGTMAILVGDAATQSVGAMVLVVAVDGLDAIDCSDRATSMDWRTH